MKLYLNDKERSLKFLKLLEILLDGAYKSSELGILTKDYIKYVDKIPDPIDNFMDYYSSELGTKLDKPHSDWIKNALYSVKGTTEVLNVFQQSFEMELRCEYEFPSIKMIEFQELELINPTLFIDKFRTLMHYLLYYSELTVSIKKLILRLVGELNQTMRISYIGFNEIKTELNAYEIE